MTTHTDRPRGPAGAETVPGARRRSNLAPYLFISPFYLGFIAFKVVPIVFSLYLSLANWNGGGAIEFAGLANFQALFADARFWNAFQVTLIITGVCTIVGTIGALALAVFLERVVDWLASLLRVIFFLPSVTSVVVIVYIWRQLYSTDYGYFNTVLTQLGYARLSWLTDTHLQVFALLIMLIWAGLGWDALIITSGLRAIPTEFYDAAKVDGAGGWAEFWNITLPLLRPTLTFVLVTGVIFLWGIFAESQLLTGGGQMHESETIALYLYNAGFRYHKFGYASAMAVVLSLLMFVSSWLNFRFVQTEVEY